MDNKPRKPGRQLNHVRIEGNLTGVNRTQNVGEHTKAVIGLANNVTITRKGEKVAHTNYFEIEVWDKRADVLLKLPVGSEIAVEGTSRMEHYTPKGSEKPVTRWYLEVKSWKLLHRAKPKAAAEAEA
jgi:single-stranded DNA-binding protein